MARFALFLNGVKIETIEDLRNNYNTKEILIAVKETKALQRWLAGRNLTEYLQKIETMNSTLSYSDVTQQLMDIFGLTNAQKEKQLAKDKKNAEIEMQRLEEAQKNTPLIRSFTDICWGEPFTPEYPKGWEGEYGFFEYLFIFNNNLFVSTDWGDTDLFISCNEGKSWEKIKYSEYTHNLREHKNTLFSFGSSAHSITLNSEYCSLSSDLRSFNKIHVPSPTWDVFYDKNNNIIPLHENLPCSGEYGGKRKDTSFLDARDIDYIVNFKTKILAVGRWDNKNNAACSPDQLEDTHFSIYDCQYENGILNVNPVTPPSAENFLCDTVKMITFNDICYCMAYSRKNFTDHPKESYYTVDGIQWKKTEITFTSVFRLGEVYIAYIESDYFEPKMEYIYYSSNGISWNKISLREVETEFCNGIFIHGDKVSFMRLLPLKDRILGVLNNNQFVLGNLI